LYKTAIAAVGKQGRWEGALSLYYEMHERGVAADAQVFTSLLKALKTGGKTESAFAFLEAMKAQNITPTRTVYNVLFSLLGEMGQFEEAVQLFEKMKKELGNQGSPYDYGTLISACGKTAVLRLREERPRAAPKGWDGLEASVPREHGEEAVNLLVRRAESLLQEILDQIRPPAAFSSRSADGGAPPHGLDPKAFFPASAHREETQDDASVVGSSASSPPYPFDRADNHGRATGRSLGIHSSSSRRRRTHDGGLGNVFTQLLKVYGKTGRWQEARNLLERMRGEGWIEPTPGHYYEAMRACAFALRPDDALGLLREARGQRGQEPGNSSKPPLILCWNAAILACQRAGRWMSCLELLKTMEGTGVCPGPSNYARAIQACGEAGKIEEAWKVYEEMGQAAGGGKGSREPVVYGSMLRLCGFHRDAPGVRRVWTDLLEAPGLGADPLNVAQAVAAWAWEIGDLDAGRVVLLGPGRNERDEATSPASVDSAPVAPPPLPFPPPLLGFHALMLATLRHGGSAEEAQVACQELVDIMMERFSLCPTSTTKAILVRAGCDVSDLFVEEDETQDWEEAEARVQELVAMNPYDPRRRKRVSEGESG
jgi:pentatricopeptide repeat protein